MPDVSDLVLEFEGLIYVLVILHERILKVLVINGHTNGSCAESKYSKTFEHIDTSNF